MNSEVELILKKLQIVANEKQEGMYLCDKEHSKLLLDYITKLKKENARLKAFEEKINFEELLKHKGEYYLSMVESQRLRK